MVALRTLLIVSIMVFSAGLAQAQDESIQSIPAMVDQMNSLWQTFREPLISSERSNIIAEQMITLRHRSGMLSNMMLARAFGLRAWAALQDGNLREAERLYSHAVALDPYSRELRVGAASVRFAQNPINIFNYLPAYFEAVLVSFDTHSGRYTLLNDIFILFGVTGVIFMAAWALYCLLIYLPLLHNSLREALNIPFTLELSGPIALLLLGLPVALAPSLWLAAMLLFTLTWVFQTKAKRIVSIVAIAMAVLGLTCLEVADDLATAASDTAVQAAFSAETFDSSSAVIAALESKLKQQGALNDDGVAATLTDDQRLQIYLYGVSLRKMGVLQGNLDLENLFAQLIGPDSIGRRARIVWGTIRIEKDDLRAGSQAYQTVLRGNDYAETFALYNLARLNYFLGNTGDAQQYFDTLKSNFARYIERFDVDTIGVRPQFIDPGLSDEEIVQFISASINEASGGKAGSALELFLVSITQNQGVWLMLIIGAGFISWLLFRSFGISRYCSSCGKRYSKHNDLDPQSSKICQSCNSLKALQTTVDGRLRRQQEDKIKSYGKIQGLLSLPTLILFPFAITARKGATILTIIVLGLWSLALSFIFTLDKMPRMEALPYFSHWSALSVLITVVLLGAVYGITIVVYVRKEGGKYGTQR